MIDKDPWYNEEDENKDAGTSTDSAKELADAIKEQNEQARLDRELRQQQYEEQRSESMQKKSEEIAKKQRQLAEDEKQYRIDNKGRSLKEMWEDRKEAKKKDKELASSAEGRLNRARNLGASALNTAARPHESGLVQNIMVIIAWIVTLSQASIGYSTITLSVFLGLALFVWVLVLRDDGPLFGQDNLKNLAKSVGLALFAMFWPIILSYFPFDFIDNNVILILGTVFSPYPLFFFVIEPRTGFMRLMQKFYSIVIFILLLFLMIIYVSHGELTIIGAEGVQIDAKSGFEAFWELMKHALDIILDWFMEIYDGVETALLLQIDRATGGALYGGKTDPNAETDLGVYFKSIEKTQSTFYEDEPVSIFAKIESATLNDPIKVNVGCVANFEEDDQMYADEVIPSYFSIDRKESEEVDCVFNEGRLEEGSHQISVFLNFEFETTAKHKTYFIDDERADALKGTGLDILEYYGIMDDDPTTTFTEGPVMIGMDFKDQPIRITDDPRPVTLGISLKNRWDGKIEKLNSLKIKMPDSMRIEDSKCIKYEMTESREGDQLVYTMNHPEEIEKFDPYITFRCPVEFVDTSAVLGTGPIATRFFQVDALYDYKLEKSISLSVSKIEEEGTPTSGNSNDDSSSDSSSSNTNNGAADNVVRV